MLRINKYYLIILFLALSIACNGQTIDHSSFTEILQKYTVEGLINYKDLKEDENLKIYLEKLSNTNPDKLKSDNDKIAFWINVYNAFTIKAIVDNYPIKSINDLHKGGRVLSYILSTTIWDSYFIKINNKEYSLNDIEHKILRKEFKESRIHFAIVCASISCPVIRNEAYVGYRLDFQLEQQAILFFNDKTKNLINGTDRVASLSKILDWFSEDFGNNENEILEYVAKYTDEAIGKDILKNKDKWSIEYLDYDWGLNEYNNK